STPIGWAIQDRSTHRGVDVFVWICHTFRMPVFFLLAGFFGRMLYEKLGPAGFVRHRAKRLLVRFVLTVVPLMPILYVLWRWGMEKAGPRNMVVLVMDLPSLELDQLRPSPGHLWFLYYLAMLLGMLTLVVSASRTAPLAGFKRGLDDVLRRLVRWRLVPIALAVPTAATLYFMQTPAADTPVDFVPQLRI